MNFLTQQQFGHIVDNHHVHYRFLPLHSLFNIFPFIHIRKITTDSSDFMHRYSLFHCKPSFLRLNDSQVIIESPPMASTEKEYSVLTSHLSCPSQSHIKSKVDNCKFPVAIAKSAEFFPFTDEHLQDRFYITMRVLSSQSSFK